MQASCFQFGILFRILSLTFKPVTASLSSINCVNKCACVYTRKNACSVTAFNSTDIRSVQDNVATPVTTMVTVCISTDALSSVFISPNLSDTNSFHQCCWSIMPVAACSYRQQQSVPNIPVSFCYIRLVQPWQPNRLFQSDTVSSDNSLIQLWYHTCLRPEGATGCNRSVAFLCVEDALILISLCFINYS